MEIGKQNNYLLRPIKTTKQQNIQYEFIDTRLFGLI